MAEAAAAAASALDAAELTMSRAHGPVQSQDGSPSSQGDGDDDLVDMNATTPPRGRKKRFALCIHKRGGGGATPGLRVS